MAGRLDEDLKDVTLLGNQNTKYLFEYSPEILEVLIIIIQTVITLLNSIALNLQAYVRKQANRILQQFILATFQNKEW